MFDTLWDMGHFGHQLLLSYILTSKVLMIINYLFIKKKHCLVVMHSNIMPEILAARLFCFSYF